jgi:hypothetical protein
LRILVAAVIFLPMGAVITLGMLVSLLEWGLELAYQQLWPWYAWGFGHDE